MIISHLPTELFFCISQDYHLLYTIKQTLYQYIQCSTNYLNQIRNTSCSDDLLANNKKLLSIAYCRILSRTIINYANMTGNSKNHKQRINSCCESHNTDIQKYRKLIKQDKMLLFWFLVLIIRMFII